MTERVVTVIQARSGSTRLPGKVLLPLGKGCVLDFMLTRVKASKLAGEIVVATTTRAEDDVIACIAGRSGVHSFRGDPLDLLVRHVRAAASLGATHVVKIPSDCPLIDPRVIDTVIDHYLRRQPALDYASNLFPATHPDGNDVEIFSFDALATASEHAVLPIEREHTTPFIWNRPKQFRVANVLWDSGRDCSRSHRLVLDYAADYDVITAVYTALGKANALFSLESAVEYLDSNPWVRDHNRLHHGVQWYHRHIDELFTLQGFAP